MNNIIKLSLTLSTILFLFNACNQTHDDTVSDEEVLSEFTDMFYEFYDTYGSGDIAFVDYYADDVITMDTEGEITSGNDSYREIWTENFKRVKIDKLEYTDPEIIYSRDMIVTYNNYDERFVFFETGDTTEVQGTWIAVWQKRDGDWKITMNTYHQKEREEE